MEVLLIGGSHDGERVEVSDKHLHTLAFFEKSGSNDVSFTRRSTGHDRQIETYIRGWEGQNPFDPVVFVLDTLTKLDAMSKLYSGYRKQS